MDTKYNWDKIRFEKGIENNEPVRMFSQSKSSNTITQSFTDQF